MKYPGFSTLPSRAELGLSLDEVCRAEEVYSLQGVLHKLEEQTRDETFILTKLLSRNNSQTSRPKKFDDVRRAGMLRELQDHTREIEARAETPMDTLYPQVWRGRELVRGPQCLMNEIDY